MLQQKPIEIFKKYIFHANVIYTNPVNLQHNKIIHQKKKNTSSVCYSESKRKKIVVSHHNHHLVSLQISELDMSSSELIDAIKAAN